MIVLVVGGGGREHAICHALKKSPKITELHCAPGNGGIMDIATCHDVKATDLEGMLSLAKKIKADYVFVAQDDPLVLGMVDILEAEGIKTFGPKRNAAILEGSKVFSKNFMKKYNIPTAEYETFSDADEAIKYLKERKTYPIVIKCDGLAFGKGAIIAANEGEAIDTVNDIMVSKKFGDSGNDIVIEEFMTGPEVTVLSFTDGKTIYPMVASTDHKRAFDNDEGLNTGGMGAIAPSPYYTERLAKESMEKVFIPTMEGMKSEGRTFKGCIYFNLMLTPNGAKVVEYNCRFGDPEAQVVLPLLKTDLFEIMEKIHEEKLSDINVEWEDMASCCVIIASGGYPEKYTTGHEIFGLREFNEENVTIYHAGTKRENGKTFTSGGRVLGITGVGKDLNEAVKTAYKGAKKVEFKDSFYRKDIGKKALDSKNV